MKLLRNLLLFFAMALLASISAAAQDTAPDLIKQARAKMLAHDIPGAIAAYTQAVTVEPKSDEAFAGLGFAKFHQGHFDEAIRDFDEAIRLNDRQHNARYGRALALFGKGDLKAADADLSADISGQSSGMIDFPHIYAWLIRVQLDSSKRADYDRELTDYLATRPAKDQNDLDAHLGAFLLGKLSADDYTSYVKGLHAKIPSQRLCEMWYFLGMKAKIDGDAARASDCFKHCLETQAEEMTEYPLAKAELDRLNAGH